MRLSQWPSLVTSLAVWSLGREWLVAIPDEQQPATIKD